MHKLVVGAISAESPGHTYWRIVVKLEALDIAVLTTMCSPRPYLDGLGGGELRVDQHQRRMRVVWLGNGREGEVCDHAGAKDDTVR